MVDSITAVSASATSQIATYQQRKQDYASLLSAVKAGDLSSAKTAYASLTANQTPPTNSPLAALGTALQGGDPAAVAKATQALQAARGGHHHHHHPSADATDASQTASTTTPASSASASNTVNILV